MNNSWYSFSVTHVGNVRKVNQDAIYVDNSKKIWLVADGMGGHSEGEKASQAITTAFKNTEFSNKLSSRVIQIENLLRSINKELQDYSKNTLNGEHIGSTVMVFTECQGVGVFIWAGDSRSYQIKGNSIKQLSWDHSHIAELVKAGHLSEQEAESSKLSNIITRAIGAHSEVYFDLFFVPLDPSSTTLLCSDGLTNELSDNEIKDIIMNYGCSQGSLNELLSSTIAKGARDNISCILIKNGIESESLNLNHNYLDQLNKNINTVSDSLYKEELTLEGYYSKLSLTIEKLFLNENKLQTSRNKALTQEMPAHDVEANESAGTQLTQQVDFKYVSLIILICALAAFSFYFIFFF